MEYLQNLGYTRHTQRYKKLFRVTYSDSKNEMKHRAACSRQMSFLLN